MKKVIALALAMTMALSMTAMAAVSGSITAAGPDAGSATGADDRLYPGESYVYNLAWGDANLKKSDYSVSVDWTKGGALVDSLKVDSVDSDNYLKLELTLKENYTIDELKDLEGDVTVTVKKDGASLTKGKYEFTFAGGVVANDLEEIDGASKRDDATVIDVVDNTIYQMTNSGWVEFCGDGNRLSSVKVRLPEDKKVFAYFNEDPIDEVEDKYYDLDADINYVNFVAKPNLGTKAEIAIQGDYSDKYYLYEYAGGKLTEIDADWNEDDGLFEFTASKLGAYVISDKALVAEADEDEKTDETTDETTESKNPDTGANDVVGVAVALAAVSLVAAGAVSLKK